MSPASAKLLIYAIDQIANWAVTAQRAKDNPDMTQDEADALVAQVQAETQANVDAWNAATGRND